MTSPSTINVLDVVALLVDLPEHGLVRGQVGTVVERFEDGAYEVEFSDDEGAINDEVAAEPGIGMDGQAFKFPYALAVDPSGNMQNGRAFQNVHDLKKLLLEDELQIARNLTQQLTVYASGAPIGFSDRAEIEAILARTRSGGYGVRSIVHEIVQSRLFQNK